MPGTSHYQELSELLYQGQITQEEYDRAIDIVWAETGYGPEAEREANSGLTLRMSLVGPHPLLSIIALATTVWLFSAQLYSIAAVVLAVLSTATMLYRDANYIRLSKGMLSVQQGCIKRRQMMIPIDIISKVELRASILQGFFDCGDVDLYLRGDTHPHTIKSLAGSEQLYTRIDLYRAVNGASTTAVAS
jgi:membrane protein YdbS with pleckstrin-like domain